MDKPPNVPTEATESQSFSVPELFMVGLAAAAVALTAVGFGVEIVDDVRRLLS